MLVCQRFGGISFSRHRGRRPALKLAFGLVQYPPAYGWHLFESTLEAKERS